MAGYDIQFDKLEWEEAAPGMRQKVVVHGQNRMRLLELTEKFREKDWCTKGHAVYVIEGEVKVQFAKRTVTATAGNGLYITGGENSRHKVSVDGGGHATLVVFESA